MTEAKYPLLGAARPGASAPPVLPYAPEADADTDVPLPSYGELRSAYAVPNGAPTPAHVPVTQGPDRWHRRAGRAVLGLGSRAARAMGRGAAWLGVRAGGGAWRLAQRAVGARAHVRRLAESGASAPALLARGYSLAKVAHATGATSYKQLADAGVQPVWRDGLRTRHFTRADWRHAQAELGLDYAQLRASGLASLPALLAAGVDADLLGRLNCTTERLARDGVLTLDNMAEHVAHTTAPTFATPLYKRVSMDEWFALGLDRETLRLLRTGPLRADHAGVTPFQRATGFHPIHMALHANLVTDPHLAFAAQPRRAELCELGLVWDERVDDPRTQAASP